MRSDAPSPTTVDEYISRCDKPAQKVLRQVRRAIRKAIPEAEEGISYQIPAYRVDGRVAVYFAAWKEHYSVYPLTRRIEAAFTREIAQYETSGKGTIRFPLRAPVPVELIQAIARLRAEDVAAAKSKAKAKAKSVRKRR
jgi:uncharacterized protein YdhG (YjbR/CyaY superfamily)